VFRSDRIPAQTITKDALGPGLYQVKPFPPGAAYTMGSRFNSDIRSKEYLYPKKADDPGPG